MRRSLSTALLLVTLLAGACGGSSDDAASTTTAPVATPTTVEALEYPQVSDVAQHLALGKDAAEIRELMAPAADGKPVDWAAVATLVHDGKNSKRGDGTSRTFANFVNRPLDLAVLEDALQGKGASAGTSDAVRRQVVDKSLTVLLAFKVLDELAVAAEKVGAKEIDPADGAPHNVDEAWAFFDAEGQGPGLTAEKRGADFDRADLKQSVVSALVTAQQASVEGDVEAFELASTDVAERLNVVFYLATYKYLDHGGDDAKRAEGATFYRFIAPAVRKADAAAADRIAKAFESGDAAAGRGALHTPAVVTALGFEPDDLVTTTS